MHLGLVCPEGAWIDIGGDRYYWKDGESMVFDDTIEHFAQNPSDQTRVIFMVDILKDGNSILTY
jgi:beta-hydroxylase